MSLSLGLAMGMALSGCGSPQDDAPTPPKETTEGDWAATPRINSVLPQPSGGALVRGVAVPGARVVLSGKEGPAVAVSADAQGLFELQVAATSIGGLLTPEIQIGQDTTPGPQQLLITGEDERLAVLLTQGGASLRLTPGPVLDVLDGDGRGLVASGRTKPGRQIVLRAGGGQAEAVADRTGRWTIVVPIIGDQAAVIQVDGHDFHYPGPGQPSDRAERAGQGWRITRQLSGVARQTSWLPDAGTDLAREATLTTR